MRREDGFSLVEMLAALGVLAIARLALVSALTQSARAATLAEDRGLAALAAETVLAEARLEGAEGLRARSGAGRRAFAGRDWDWRITPSTTPDPGLERVTVEVSEEGARRTGYVLTSFQRAAR
jgi:general secretion pathway protein I